MKIKFRKEDRTPGKQTEATSQKGLSRFALVFIACGFLLLFSLFMFSLYVHYKTPDAYRPGIGFYGMIRGKLLGTWPLLIKTRTIDLENPSDEQGDSLATTKLPVFELYIPQESQDILYQAIPEVTYDPATKKITGETSLHTGEEGFQWPFVPAKLKYKDKTYDVEIRYRGWFYDHYRLEKKSWRVRFNKDDLFYGLREINIINQRAQIVFSNVLQGHLLREAGFLIPDQYLVHLRINDEYAGVQTFVEQPDEYFLTRHNRERGDIYGEISPIHSFEEFSDVSNWQKYASWQSDSDFSSLERLIAVLRDKRAPDFKERIERILDVNQYLTYCADAAITAKVNPSSHNNRLYYDPTLGKFQFLPWYQMGYFYSTEVAINSPNPSLEEFDLGRVRPVDLILNDFHDGLFRVPEYHEMFYRKVWELINTTYHPNVLLQLVDYMYEEVKEDVYADAHIHSGVFPTHYITNEEWEKAVADMRAMIIAWDNYIRTYLSKSNLTVSLLPLNERYTAQDENDMAAIGTLQIYTSEMVSPTVQKVTLRVEGLSDESLEDIVILEDDSMASDQQRVAIHAQSINRATKEITFALNKTIISDKEAVPFRGPVSGLFVTGFENGAELKSLPTVYNYLVAVKGTASVQSLHRLSIQSVSAINSITGEAIEPVIVETEQSFEAPQQFNPERGQTYSEAPGLVFISEEKEPPSKKITWQKGKVEVNEDIILDSDTVLNIEPGTVVEIAKGKSLLIYGQVIAEGTEQDKIVFRSKTDEPWGVLAVSAPGLPPSVFRHAIFENGSMATLDGVEYTGALSIYNGDALIENCLFQNNIGDDALNSVYSDTRVTACRFVNNKDAIDYDFCGGTIMQSTFEDNEDDAIDLSFSNTKILDNNIINSGDRGISIGEKSAPLVFNNLIVRCDMDIAVKDLSDALILNNTISKNRVGVSLFIKTFNFGPAKAHILNSIIWDNRDDIEIKDGSVLTIEYSNTGQLLDGAGNMSVDPLFVAPDRNDFDLKQSSPCIQKGNGGNLSEFLPGQNLLLNDMGVMLRTSTEQ